MADFITVLQNRDKKWTRKHWEKLDIECVYFEGGFLRACYKKGTWNAMSFTPDPTDLVADDWEEFKEPEQIKVWMDGDKVCPYFYFAKDPMSKQHTEATPEQLAQIRKALGL